MPDLYGQCLNVAYAFVAILTIFFGCSAQYIRGFDHYNFIRKPASDFGWDWGPAFAPSGVYGYISLEAYSLAFLTGAPPAQHANSSYECPS